MLFLYGMLAYLAILNGYGFLLMGYDKRKAKRGKRRVPEKRFFLTAAIGGALGIWYGMKTWRHKTLHRSFTVGIPYLIAVNLILVILLVGFWGSRMYG